MHIPCEDRALTYLSKKDVRLARVIEKVGPLERPMQPDLFSAIVFLIIGQQISTAAQETIWQRLLKSVGESERVDAGHILSLSLEALKNLGISYRKAGYIRDFAERVASGDYQLDALKDMDDEAVIESLSSLKGIGRWTAEMLLIFSLGREDVLSYGDLGIRRGLCMLYHHREIDEKKFARYKKRYAPYGSVASLYLWAIAEGLVEGMQK